MQVPPVVAVPALEVQVCGEPRACVPFMNWTVPVGPAPFFVEPVTVAVSVTEAPDATDVALAVSAAEVGVVPEFVTLMVALPLLEP